MDQEITYARPSLCFPREIAENVIKQIESSQPMDYENLKAKVDAQKARILANRKNENK